MKKIIALLLAAVMCLSLAACGKSEELKNVETLVEAIGEVNVDSESAIIAAEEAYNKLNDEEKSKVENYELLTAARAAYEELFESVEITLDNWEDYFEFREVPVWIENDFGEVTELELYSCFCIKNEYADKIILERSELTWELVGQHTFAAIECDFKNKTYSLEAVDASKIALFNPDAPETYTLESSYIDDAVIEEPNIIFSDSICSHNITDKPWKTNDGSEVYEIFPCELTRIQGNIVVIK